MTPVYLRGVCCNERRIAGDDDRRPAVGDDVAEKRHPDPSADRLLAMGFLLGPNK